MRTTFFTYFTSAYGTLVFIMFALSFVTDKHVNIGALGYYGFPVFALVYAFYRRSRDITKLSATTARGSNFKT